MIVLTTPRKGYGVVRVVLEGRVLTGSLLAYGQSFAAGGSWPREAVPGSQRSECGWYGQANAVRKSTRVITVIKRFCAAYAGYGGLSYRQAAPPHNLPENGTIRVLVCCGFFL